LAAIGFGSFLCALGIVAFYNARLGLPPWGVLHDGIARQTLLSFGAANLVVGLLLLAVAALLRAPLGWGTGLSVLMIGVFVMALERIPHEPGALPLRVTEMLAGLGLLAAGIALYVSADMGGGPRDALMLCLAARYSIRISVAGTGLELLALCGGLLLGGKAGVGTFVYALAVTPGIAIFFRLIAGLTRAQRRGVISSPRLPVRPR
jgi:uncharacterized membrane protein YczE